MAFPLVQTTATTNGSAASASPVVNLPTGIVSGDLLIVLFRTAIGSSGVGWPAGWTELVESIADASDDAQAIGYRQAGASEPATISLTTASAKFAAIAYRISGAANPANQAPQVSAVATGTSATPDPASLTPTGGAKDYLWLWLGGWEGEQTSPPAGNPTNYATPLGADSGTGGAIPTNVRVASARRSINAASEDPGSWTISVSDDWTAWTLAVHPAPPVVTLAAAPAGVATVSSAMVVARRFAATSAGVASVAVALAIARRLAAVSAGGATVAGAVAVARRLAAVVNATGTAAGALAASRPFAALATGIAIIASALGITRNLAANAAGVALVSASLAATRGLGGASAGIATVTAALSVAFAFISAFRIACGTGSSPPNIACSTGRSTTMSKAGAGRSRA